MILSRKQVSAYLREQRKEPYVNDGIIAPLINTALHLFDALASAQAERDALREAAILGLAYVADLADNPPDDAQWPQAFTDAQTIRAVLDGEQ